MCDVCERAKTPAYGALIAKMLEEDEARLAYSRTMAAQLAVIGKSVYSSVNWPLKLAYPFFEARAAYAVPNNYFQNLTVDGERLGNSFAHGAMRSVFFAGGRLILFSKAVNFRDAKEFFTSFILLHLDREEYESQVDESGIRITAQVEKPMLNLITGMTQMKKIAFSFVHQKVAGRIVSREHVATSTRFREVYGKYGGVSMNAGSIDMEGYAITVPHFAPHPYLLQMHEQFGYESNRQFQEHVEDYFRAHLQS
jgi:hypothetical protein